MFDTQYFLLTVMSKERWEDFKKNQPSMGWDLISGLVQSTKSISEKLDASLTAWLDGRKPA